MATDEELQALENASNASAEKASVLLDVSLKKVMAHVAHLDQLKPKMADEATYRKLLAVIQDATRKNESIASLRSNIEKLGSGAVAMFNQMAALAGRVV